MKDQNEAPEEKGLEGLVQDVAESTLEAGTSLVLDSLPELGAKAAEIAGNEAFCTAVQAITGGLLGAIAPTLFNIKLSFQQKRFERNTIKMLDSIILKQEIIEQRLDALDPTIRQKFIDGPYRDVLLDNIISENQEQKVQDNINGYINLMAVENPNDDIVITFFNTLSQMNELDIRILRLYQPRREANEGQETYFDIVGAGGISESQYRFIQEKLDRLGMLESKNEENRDENLDVIGKALSELIKQLHAKNPKEVKMPRLKQISRSESYHITSLGRQYLSFVEEPR